jgi:VWFA-related protein
VVDRDGRPVTGLGAQDFAVLEDGRPVQVTYFEAVSPDGAEDGPPLAAGAGPAAIRRRILLLVDSARMTPAQLQRARVAAARFVRHEAGDGDWIRLVNLASGRAWDGAIPADRRELEAAARRLTGRPSPWLTGVAVTDPIRERVEADDDEVTTAETSGQFLSAFAQTADLLGALESILVQLGGVPGRKALVFVSPGFPQLRGLDRRLENVASLAREAATTVYFVDAAGLDGLLPEPGGRLRSAFEVAWQRGGGAQDLAEATGGFTSRFSNALLPALARVRSEMRTYYVLGYLPPGRDDGRFRAVEVTVRRRGLAARTKKGYLAGGRR